MVGWRRITTWCRWVIRFDVLIRLFVCCSFSFVRLKTYFVVVKIVWNFVLRSSFYFFFCCCFFLFLLFPCIRRKMMSAIGISIQHMHWAHHTTVLLLLLNLFLFAFEVYLTTFRTQCWIFEHITVVCRCCFFVFRWNLSGTKNWPIRQCIKPHNTCTNLWHTHPGQ